MKFILKYLLKQTISYNYSIAHDGKTFLKLVVGTTCHTKLLNIVQSCTNAASSEENFHKISLKTKALEKPQKAFSEL